MNTDQIDRIRKSGRAFEHSLESAERLAEEARAAGLDVRIDEYDLEALTWYEVTANGR